MKKFKDVVAALKREGAREVTRHIKDVSIFTYKDKTFVRFLLDEGVEAFVKQEDESYAKGMSDTIIMPRMAVRRCLQENSAFCGFDREILSSEAMAKLILVEAEIKVLCEDVEEEVLYHNPFIEDSEEKPAGHTSIYHHLVGVEMAKTGVEHMSEFRQSVYSAALAKR